MLKTEERLSDPKERVPHAARLRAEAASTQPNAKYKRQNANDQETHDNVKRPLVVRLGRNSPLPPPTLLWKKEHPWSSVSSVEGGGCARGQRGVWGRGSVRMLKTEERLSDPKECRRPLPPPKATR